MKFNEKHRRIVEIFLNEWFKECELKKYEHHHTHADGYWIHTTIYSLGKTEILMVYERTDSTEAIFCRKFLWSFGSWIPIKYKRYYMKEWFFTKYLPNFAYKDLVHI